MTNVLAGYPTELVLVCCHAIFNVNTTNPWNEANWHLKAFQKSDENTSKISEHFTFISHIQAAAESLRRPNTFVVFSGGATDPAIPYSEAESYEKVFLDLYSKNDAVMQGHRWVCEVNAIDSYQNLLFSVIEFRRKVGHYPETINVITHAFKSDRFFKLHGPAIRWHPHRLRVLGINPPFHQHELEQIQKAEYTNAFALFRTDPYGNESPLVDKRGLRKWNESKLDDISEGLEDGVRALLLYRGSELFRDQKLPWE